MKAQEARKPATAQDDGLPGPITFAVTMFSSLTQLKHLSLEFVLCREHNGG